MSKQSASSRAELAGFPTARISRPLPLCCGAARLVSGETQCGNRGHISAQFSHDRRVRRWQPLRPRPIIASSGER